VFLRSPSRPSTDEKEQQAEAASVWRKASESHPAKQTAIRTGTGESFLRIVCFYGVQVAPAQTKKSSKLKPLLFGEKPQRVIRLSKLRYGPALGEVLPAECVFTESKSPQYIQKRKGGSFLLAESLAQRVSWLSKLRYGPAPGEVFPAWCVFAESKSPQYIQKLTGKESRFLFAEIPKLKESSIVDSFLS